MTVLRDLLLAEEQADAARRALAAIPGPFRTPGDAQAANGPNHGRPRRAAGRTAPTRTRTGGRTMTSAHDGKGMYQLKLTDAEWEAWAEGADLDDILAARPQPTLIARIAEFFQGEPEAGL